MNNFAAMYNSETPIASFEEKKVFSGVFLFKISGVDIDFCIKICILLYLCSKTLLHRSVHVKIGFLFNEYTF